MARLIQIKNEELRGEKSGESRAETRGESHREAMRGVAIENRGESQPGGCWYRKRSLLDEETSGASCATGHLSPVTNCVLLAVLAVRFCAAVFSWATDSRFSGRLGETTLPKAGDSSELTS